MLNDPLAAALSRLMNAERRGQRVCRVRVSSSTVTCVLRIFNEHHYIGACEESVEDGRGTVLSVQLLGRINQCGVIKPRFSAKAAHFEQWEKRYLPAKNFGILIVSTPKGLMTHHQAKEQHIGGVLVAYCY